MNTHTHSQQGQTLLVMALLISLVVTVVVATSHRLTSETELTEVQEQSIRVLAAADSGLEKGLSLSPSNSSIIKTYSELALNLEGIDQDNSRVIINPINTTTLVSPLVLQDKQFTLHLSDYPDFTTFFTGNLNIYFDSEGASACAVRTTPAVEITLVYGSDQVQRWLMEPCSSNPYIHSNGINDLALSTGSFPLTFDGTSYTFNYKTSSSINLSAYSNPKFLFVRTLFDSTRFGFVGNVNLPAQGRTVRSETYSVSGVSRIVSVYETLPQIFSDIYVTTF